MGDEFIDQAASKGGVDAPTIGLAKEVARTILRLLSDEAAYCTGVTINVSGAR